MDIKKLQKLVVSALEDVKAQDIQVFDTIHLTSMFDRIAIASGTSNRQTKALAASVRDKIKQAGGNVISIEGENTGEWVLVDLGDMVVHIMQPTIRAYYRLEELWGDKPVNLAAAKRNPRKPSPVPAKTSAKPKKSAKPVASKTAKEDSTKKSVVTKKPSSTKSATATNKTQTKQTSSKNKVEK